MNSYKTLSSKSLELFSNTWSTEFSMTFLEATARLSGDIWATCNMGGQLCMQMVGVKNMPRECTRSYTCLG